MSLFDPLTLPQNPGTERPSFISAFRDHRDRRHAEPFAGFNLFGVPAVRRLRAVWILGENQTGPGYAIGMMHRSPFFLMLLALLALTPRGHAQGDSDAESKFIAMVKNATLKGTWAPIAGGQLGSEKKDEAYRIVRAEKKEDGQWNIVSLFEVRGELVEFSIPAVVKFAGDTAVLMLDNVRAGPGRANWSARVMFHDEVYTGRWWETANREHGGTIAGIVTRPSN